MAAALMTQWLFNFVIAKLTPIMLANITYGTFLLFGSCCIFMVVFTVFFVPETAGIPQETIYMLFEGKIVKEATRDTFPKSSRAKVLKNVRNVEADTVDGKGYATHVEEIGVKAGSSRV